MRVIIKKQEWDKYGDRIAFDPDSVPDGCKTYRHSIQQKETCFRDAKLFKLESHTVEVDGVEYYRPLLTHVPNPEIAEWTKEGTQHTQEKYGEYQVKLTRLITEEVWAVDFETAEQIFDFIFNHCWHEIDFIDPNDGSTPIPVLYLE